MSNRPFITFNNNETYVAKLLFDQPTKAEGQYGEKHIYAIEIEGTEFVTSQSPGGTLDNALGAGAKGDVFTIWKILNDKKNFVFQVEKGNTASKEAVKPSDQLKPTEENKEKAGRSLIPDTPPPAPQTDWDLKEQKTQHEIMKAVCLKLAVDKIPEGSWSKKIETEIKGKYTTLMLIISDDLEIALAKLKTAQNVFHLSAMWRKYSKLWGSILSHEDYTTAINLCADMKAKFEAEEAKKNPVETVAEIEVVPIDDEPLPF